MKTARLLLSAGAFVFFGGCNCAGREFTVAKTFSVHSEAKDALCSTERLAVNLGEDKSFSDSKQFIGAVELRKVALTVTNPKTRTDSLAANGNGVVSISEQQTGSAIELGTYGDVPIADGSTKEIVFDKAAAKSLATMALRPPNTFYLEAKGCNDVNPAFYDFKVELTFFAEPKIF
jgi:hypothetical protein